MIVRSLPTGVLVVSPPAHALLAFQLADHWGNRATPRPAPRADVLAAVLLHDSGWDDLGEPPRLGPDGAPLAFDAWPASEREAVWRTSVERAGACGRYVAWLVSHHASMLAQRSSAGTHTGFLAAEEQRRALLAADLAADPRYRQVLATGADAVNRAIVRITDALAVHLILGLAAPVTLAELPRRSGNVPLEVRPVTETSVRLQPWPFAGQALTVSVEAMRLPAARYADQAALSEAWRAARRSRLSWTLLGPGTPER
jgi:hypothetical protein